MSEKVYHKAKLLLQIYRDVIWSIEDRVCEIEEEYFELGSNRLKDALDFLNDYDININKRTLEERVSSIFKSKWLIEMVDKALIKIKKYPNHGEVYFDILYNQYISEFKHSEAEIISKLHCERTTFYKKKKEAINLMGVVLWGYIIPSFRELWNEKCELKLN